MIPVTYIRSSSYGCHDMCQMKAFGEYTLGWSGPGNLKADKGTMTHKALELLACAKLAQQQGQKTYVDEEFFGELSSDVDTLDVDNIIERVYEHYSQAFTQHNWQTKDLKDVRLWTWKALHFKNGAFDPRKRTIVAPEAPFDLELKDDWAKYEYDYMGKTISGQLSIKGTIDLVTELSPGVLEVVDWKTGRRINWATGEEKTHDKLRGDAQLRMYHYAIQCLYPDVDQILFTIFYINDGGPYTVDFYREDIPDTLDMLRRKYEAMSNTDHPEMIRGTQKGWKCNKFCHQGMSTFEKTNVKPLVETRWGQVTPKGSIMCKCEQINYTLQHRTITSVITNMSKEGFNCANYKAPGSTE